MGVIMYEAEEELRKFKVDYYLNASKGRNAIIDQLDRRLRVKVWTQPYWHEIKQQLKENNNEHR